MVCVFFFEVALVEVVDEAAFVAFSLAAGASSDYICCMASRKLLVSESSWVTEEENSLRFLRLLSHDPDGPDLSVTMVEIDGRHRELRTLNSSRLYVILEGNLQFTIRASENDSPQSKLDASKGELVVIERGDWYSLQGTGQYLVINGPAIRPGDDIYSAK